MKPTVAASWMVRLGLAVALVAIALAAAGPVIPPNPVPASAPKSTFSAQRAMEDLKVVARETVVIISADHYEPREVQDVLGHQGQARRGTGELLTGTTAHFHEAELVGEEN